MPADQDLIETGLAIGTSIAIARSVTVEQAEAYASAASSEQERTHTLDSMLDPTGYRDKGPRADAAANVARAFLEFRSVIEQSLAPEHMRAG